MATIYNVPKEVKLPKVEFANYNHAKEIQKEEKFLKELRALIKPHSKSKYNGKIARFSVADGYALYMVASIRPLELIHLPLGDAWEFQYIKSLKGKDITSNIDSQERLAKIFS